MPWPTRERMRIAPAVERRERDGDRQAEAGAAMALGELVAHLLERAAELLQRLARDADAGIGDREDDGIAGGAGAYADAAALRA